MKAIACAIMVLAVIISHGHSNEEVTTGETLWFLIWTLATIAFLVVP